MFSSDAFVTTNRNKVLFIYYLQLHYMYLRIPCELGLSWQTHWLPGEPIFGPFLLKDFSSSFLSRIQLCTCLSFLFIIEIFCFLYVVFIAHFFLLTSFWVHSREFLSPLATDVTSISVNLQKQTIYCDNEWVMFTSDYISRSLKKSFFRKVCLESLLLCQFILDVF